MKDYIKDVKQCIKRLFYCEKMLDRFLDTGGKEKGFFDSLSLEGIKSDYRHPILDYGEEEKKLFTCICGEPLQVPRDFSHSSPQEIRQLIIKRRNELRYIAGMIEGSRFLGEKNYLCYRSRKKRYFTGRLID